LHFSAIFFDFDGVMADTMPWHLPAWKQVIEEQYGFPFQPMIVKLNEGRPAVDIAKVVFEDAGQDYTPEILAHVVDQKNALFRANSKACVYPENFEIIQHAQDAGLRVGLVTGTRLENVHALLPEKLLADFDAIIVDGDVERGKPCPDPYVQAAQRCRVEPNNCLVIENAPLGIQAGKSAGMFCIALKTTLSSEHLQAADVIFENHAELLANIGKYIST